MRPRTTSVAKTEEDPTKGETTAAVLNKKTTAAAVGGSEERTRATMHPPNRTDHCNRGRPLEALLESLGFDRAEHERIRSDMISGRIGLAMNRLPPDTVLADVDPDVGERRQNNDGGGGGGVIFVAERDVTQDMIDAGRTAIAEGTVAVITLAAGIGTRLCRGDTSLLPPGGEAPHRTAPHILGCASGEIAKGGASARRSRHRKQRQVRREVVPRRIDDRGGGLAIVNGRPRLVEGLAPPREEDEFGLSCYNSMTTWIDVDGLLRMFGLVRSDLSDEVKVRDAARRLTRSLPTDVTLKDVKRRWGNGQEDVFPVAQFEKLWGDVTALPRVECLYFVVPRKRGQQLKDPAQLDGWLRDASAEYLESICEWE